jgi:hypothetical protein
VVGSEVPVTSAVFGHRRGRDLLLTAARGAILIGLAVIVGVVLVQITNDAGGGGPSTGGPTATTGTTVTTGTGGASTTTTTETPSVKGARPASQIVVQVLNGSGVQGAAAQRSNDLKAKGYQVQPAGNATARTGTAVQCTSGYQKEATALVNVLATLSIRATIEAYPSPPPAGVSAQAHCLVILGR